MKDDHAKRVRETYPLDEQRFRNIINTLYDQIEGVKKTSEAGSASSAPAVILNLGLGEILIKAEYHLGDVSKTVLFDYVGRLAGGSKIGRGSSLYLQTFNPPGNHAAAVPNPNLAEALREYIRL